MGVTAAAAVGIAFALDLTVEEFPESFHPVVVLGRVIAPFDREWSRPRAVGAAVALVVPLLAGGTAAGVTSIASSVDPWIGATVAGIVLFSTTSLRMLLTVAAATIGVSETDLATARERVSALVGRDPSTLDPGELRSAAVESLAENLADGLVAPLLAFVLLSPWLPLAAGAAAWVKAVNTADSMLGYRSKPVGRASARLDDVVMWLPARVSAVVIAVAALEPGALLVARPWARVPPSPNSGWPMATIAAVLSVTLEKPGSYALGEGPLPTVENAREGVRIVAAAGAMSFVAAGVIAWA